ncbi:proline iminopeptidase [Coniophora puteana RWD-64-598 SS2]|uniref:Proline iminopeptidase n=1 Tax=Coniophora puteana (strain RWD-64-598) TaxID=741705 RepID=A0A5M3MNR1_CONPW|nr:proline iminopeptidase [Coniophora puteana RWD-64-598 SS2]EIW80650.1 proline iminopeptidase [Coniophora puteana RWD-64-598 SS2]
MATVRITEGTMDFDVPSVGKRCQTWYKIYGDLADHSRTPTIILHGGPGYPHYYVEPIAQTLATRLSSSAVIYDQLGCGNSTHLPDRNTKEDESFWTIHLFMDELNTLINHLGIQDGYNIIGHSWGGILATSFAVRKPAGLKSLVLISSPAHIGLFNSSLDRLVATLPATARDVIGRHKHKRSDSPDYKEGHMAFVKKFLCRLDETPEVIAKTMKSVREDPTVAHVMLGPSDYEVTGVLENHNVVDELHNISVPTLITNGWYDKVQDVAVEPYFRHIQKVKWVQFAESAHFPWLEEEEKFYNVLSSFLHI